MKKLSEEEKTKLYEEVHPIKPLIIVFILTAGKILADNICHAGMNVTIFILAREME